MKDIWKKENKIYEICNQDYRYLESNYLSFNGDYIIDSTWNLNFRKEILRLLKKKKVISYNFNKLEEIHNYVLDKSLLEYDFDSGVNGITKKLYDVDKSFMKVYENFIKDLYKRLKFDFYFQDYPTIRVHCPDAKNQNHYPRYHNDCFYGHPPEEINVWFSLTENNKSGFHLINFDKSKEWFSKYDYDVEKFINEATNNKEFNKNGNDLSFEVKSDLSEIFIFNSLCIHTNQPRVEDSRVSIDIRINPVDRFVDGYVGSGRMKAEFKPNGKFGYYKKSIKELINVL